MENPTRKVHVCSISTRAHNGMHVYTHSESNAILSRIIVLKNCIYIFESFVNFPLAIAVRATNTFYYFLKTSHLLNFYWHTYIAHSDVFPKDTFIQVYHVFSPHEYLLKIPFASPDMCVFYVYYIKYRIYTNKKIHSKLDLIISYIMIMFSYIHFFTNNKGSFFSVTT